MEKADVERTAIVKWFVDWSRVRSRIVAQKSGLMLPGSRRNGLAKSIPSLPYITTKAHGVVRELVISQFLTVPTCVFHACG